MLKTLISFIVFIVCAQNVFGDIEYKAPCIALQAEYLYLKPCLDNDFVASTNVNNDIPFNLQPGGPGERNPFDYTSGFRLSGYYFNPNACSFIQNGCLRFTSLPAHHSKTIDLPTSSSTLSFVKAHHRLKYYGTDLFVTVPIFHHPCWRFSTEPGIHYAFMSYDAELNAPSIPAKLKERSTTWGIGPELGFNMNYNFWQRVSINADVRGGLLVSNAKAHLRFQPKLERDLRNPRSLWKVFPFWEVNVDLGICFCMGGYFSEVKVGYAYLTYTNFIDRIQFPDVESSSQPGNQFTNIDFKGPYVSWLISF